MGISRRHFIAGSVAGAVGAWGWNASASAGESETVIFTNGRIITSDPDFSIAEAMAVCGSRILAVGSEEAVRAMIPCGIPTVDLGGRTVLPGLIDSHLHAVMAAVYEFDHVVPDMESVADVLAYFKDRAQKVPEDEWIGLDYVFITRLAERRYPTREEIDAVAPNHPVYFQTGPDAVLNSKAMELCGIDSDNPAFSIGRIERSADGKPTGLLRKCDSLQNIIVEMTTAKRNGTPIPPEKERQAEIFTSKTLKIPNEDEQLEALACLFKAYNSVGFTTISDRDTFPQEMTLFQRLKERKIGYGMTCRVCSVFHSDQSLSVDDYRRQVEEIAGMGISRTDNDLWLQGVKFYMDGGMLTGSARLIEPYGVSSVYGIEDPEYRGVLFVDTPKTVEIVRAITDFGLQPTAHSVGDGAVKTLVDAYEILSRERDLSPCRPCLSHANFMNPEIIDKMVKVGIAADMQPAWLYQDGATLNAHFGQDRLTWFQPYRTLIDRGILIGGGSDHMLKTDPERSINRYNPFLAMQTMITRRARNLDFVFHPEQKVSRIEAIRFYTSWNARLIFRENDLGSLEPGKLADFIVIDRNILTCPEEEIAGTRVEEVWLNGRKILG